MNNLNLENMNEKEKVYRGAITIFYKRIDGELVFLVAENSKTGNITLISGAEEDIDESLESCAQREIEEELGLLPNQYQLKSTNVKHEFVFGSKKPERTGSKGSYQVFLADALKINEVGHTEELKGIKWMTEKEAIDSLSFPDLKEVFKTAIQEIE